RAGDGARRCGDDDVGAERQLRVDARLLVVGGGEDAEVDAEGEQQPDREESAVDRLAAATGAREQEADGCRRTAARRTAGEPGDEPGDGEREQVEVELLPERRPGAADAPARFADAAAEDAETGAHPRCRGSRNGERGADAERRQQASAPDAACRAGETKRGEG